MTVVAKVSKQELDELRVQQHAVAILKNQYWLANRGFSARVGEILRRYRRVDDERLFIDFTTGDVKLYETPRSHMPNGIEPAQDTDAPASEPTNEQPVLNGPSAN